MTFAPGDKVRVLLPPERTGYTGKGHVRVEEGEELTVIAVDMDGFAWDLELETKGGALVLLRSCEVDWLSKDASDKHNEAGV